MDPRTLHVAAMPFPSRQGTQAAVRAMLDVLAGAGRETHLATYAHGAFEIAHDYAIHRIPDFPRDRSLRSGPSLAKLALDARLALETRRVARRIRPDVVVAHHVEAMAAALAARACPLLFFAHTALAPELPAYLPTSGVTARAAAALGATVDWAFARRAGAIAAVAPALRDEIARLASVEADYVPIPWPVPAPITHDERIAARAELRLAAGTRVVLYAGNLDAYQGWPDVVAAIARLRPRTAATLLVATASDPAPIRGAALTAGIPLEITDLEGEPARRRAHAAADVAVVPRRTAGGLPIKLLDALARGVPTVAAARATAGLDLRAAALITADDDPDALATGISIALAAPDASAALAAAGRAWIAAEQAPARFLDAFDRATARARRRQRPVTR